MSFLSKKLMAAIVSGAETSEIVSNATGVNTGGTSLTINKPSSVNSGDLLLAFTLHADTESGQQFSTVPSGWTTYPIGSSSHSNTCSLAVFTKTVGGSEPSSYTWSGASNSREGGGVIFAISGAGLDVTSRPTKFQTGSGGTNTLTGDPSSLTAATDGSIAFFIAGTEDSNQTIATPSGFTSVYSGATRIGGTGQSAMFVYTKNVDAGSTGVVSAAHSNANGQGYGLLTIVGPRLPPSSGTEVYNSFSYSGNNTDRIIGSSSQNPTDMVITQPLNIGFDNTISSRLTGNTKYQRVSGAAAEETFSNGAEYDQPYGQKIIGNELTLNRTGYTYQAHHFSRASGFFDCVFHGGTGSAQSIAHQLSVVPEMIWVRNRSASDAWAVYFGDNTDYLVLSSTAAADDDSTFWDDTSPTSSVFTVGTNHSVNASGENYISYLFSSLAGISKVGSIVHGSSDTNVDAGFSNGSRFILLKRTDSTSDWIIWNSVTGIVSGDDPYKILNDTANQVTNTDFIDPYSAGFTLTSSFTAGTYLYLAIA